MQDKNAVVPDLSELLVVKMIQEYIHVTFHDYQTILIIDQQYFFPVFFCTTFLNYPIPFLTWRIETRFPIFL